MYAVLLETERFFLRSFLESDIENLYEIDNDPDVMRFINGGAPTPPKVLERQIFPTFLHYDPAYPGCGFWAFVENSSNRFLGWLSFRPTGANPLEVSLGFRLRKTAWGKGYATEGAQALINLGFTEMGVQSVKATTYEENLASRRVMEKIGMKLVRSFRLTPADLEKADTFHVDSVDIWDGNDLEYLLSLSEWEMGQISGEIIDR